MHVWPRRRTLACLTADRPACQLISGTVGVSKAVGRSVLSTSARRLWSSPAAYKWPAKNSGEYFSIATRKGSLPSMIQTWPINSSQCRRHFTGQS